MGILHLITERKLSGSSVNIAINALRAFYHGLLGQDLEPLLAGIKRPSRVAQPPRLYGADEIEQLITVGTAGDPLGRVFLMTVFGGGFRLSEATHLQIEDIDAPRMQLRVSHPKGGRQRVTVLSDALLFELRMPFGYLKMGTSGLEGRRKLAGGKHSAAPGHPVPFPPAPWRGAGVVFVGWPQGQTPWNGRGRNAGSSLGLWR